MELVCREAADVCSVALCFGKIQVVGRKGGEEGVWLQGPVWGASTRGDAGMKGWALAASLDSWCSLADPPLTEDPGDLGSGNSIFFFLFCPEVFCLLHGPEGKAGLLPIFRGKPAPLGIQGLPCSCCMDMLWGTEGGGKCVPPGGRPEATPECPSYGQFLPAGRTKGKKSWCPKQEG